MYIAIEGPIGVGKTTLAKFLAKKLKAETLLEVVEENPFLPHFYQDPKRYGFSVQAFFLLSRYKQLLPMSQPRLFTGSVVTDYIFNKDYIFASMNLSAAEWELYADLYKHLAPRLSAPDLTLYLQAPTHILLKRIAKRGRPFEHNIEAAYLERLSGAYNRYFATYPHPLWSLGTETIDYVDHAEHRDWILDEILTRTGLPIPT